MATIEVSGTTIRLHGIDAPEVAQPYGKDVTAAIAALADNQEGHCEGKRHDD